VAVRHSVDPVRWQRGLDELMARIAHRFGRVEPRRRVRRGVLGLLAGLPRANCWTLAEHAGDHTPDGLQHLLGRAVWDHDAVRDDLRGYVLDHLGDEHAVLVVDETGDLKKGTHTVGVQRQYTGTAGRIENAQVAVYLTYASAAGHAFIDRTLYLPRSWTDDPDRCAQAGVPDRTPFATKPQLAAQMIARALDAGAPASWVAGDEVYGNDPQLRAMLHQRHVGYVLAVACDHRVRTHAGIRRAVDLAVTLPASVWQTRSCGTGSKGHRWYAWAMVDLADQQVPGQAWLLIRRNRRTGEYAFYRCYSPTPVPISALVAVAGRRWTVEENFQQGKELAGLDEHQVRRWTSWHRWTVLAMLAHAFLAVTAAAERANTTTTTTLVPLTCNEIRHLFIALIDRVTNLDHLLDWSRWRRQHQARARASHHRRQALTMP
jgi:SRSO17 transposase